MRGSPPSVSHRPASWSLSSFIWSAGLLSMFKKVLIRLYCYGFFSAWTVKFFKAIKPLKSAW